MLFLAGHEQAFQFVSAIDSELRTTQTQGLSNKQKAWLAAVLTGIIVTASVNWDEFSRRTLGRWGATVFGSMLRRISQDLFQGIWWASLRVILGSHGIEEGVLVVDDSDRPRSKNTKEIFAVHKAKDKKSGGYFMAQNIVLLLLVTRKVTIPVGFDFFRPDPGWKAWEKEEKRLKKAGFPKARRPPRPERHPDFPTRAQIAVRLMREFKYRFPGLRIKAIAFDAAYLSKFLRAECARIYPGVQVISELRSNQLARAGHQTYKTLSEYFSARPLRKVSVLLRGGLEKSVEMTSARLFIKALGRKVHVVAMRYENETELRYISAVDMTWRAENVVKAYSLRWLVEVAFQDWKLYEGFGGKAMQQGVEGARRGLLLSFLADHFLLHHPVQLNLSRSGKPLCTVGALASLIRIDCLIETTTHLMRSPDLATRDVDIAAEIRRTIPYYRESSKHMSGRGAFDFGPSSSLKGRHSSPKL